MYKRQAIEGTGIGGRVSSHDLFASIPATSEANVTETPEFYEEKLPNIRKVIAKSMHASLSQMAQLTLNTSCLLYTS